MKKLFIYGMISLIVLSVMPSSVEAKANPSAMPAESPAARALLLRLDEINTMDKSQLSTSEKKDLRKEVRSIKKELKTMNQGVYLSVGAIIIIVLLLILLL